MVSPLLRRIRALIRLERGHPSRNARQRRAHPYPTEQSRTRPCISSQMARTVSTIFSSGSERPIVARHARHDDTDAASHP
jgi:hypothetical protein